ncbi:DinB family protein [Nibribacter koreensis]|uniref:DinB-like domain-containing protein n=1 Tax=Nibribacter koreensis TaxID=1084519 RepID=A0ABP8FAK1_9BACT
MDIPAREVWQRGPLPGVPSILQPVAHALLQAEEEVQKEMQAFPEELLWKRLGGVASVGFHLQHLTGVLDRLFTYALAQPLQQEQLQSLAIEGKESPDIVVSQLVAAFHGQVEKAIAQLKNEEETQLLAARGIGRAQIPTTVLGLYVHAAEHTMRHVGQLLVTARILKSMTHDQRAID